MGPARAGLKRPPERRLVQSPELTKGCVIMGKYILNKETQKIELHFSKAEYLALTDAQKSEIKSYFLWSGKAGAWVSRSTNNHYWPVKIAEKLGLEDGGNIGERLSYAEELERKTERAEARAERFEGYAENAEKRGKLLASALDKYRGDIAFFTQPIIAGHAGSRAFANYRERLYRRVERGYEEYKKSEYYQERAAIARATADNAKLKNPVYLHNRIKECNANLKKYQESIIAAENNLYKLQQGEILKAWDGSLLTIEGQEQRIENLLEKYDYEHDKLEFFENAMTEVDGNRFSQSNIRVGYIVQVQRWGRCEIVAAGPVNVTYKILDGGAAGGCLTDPYAAIVKIIAEKEVPKVVNPFQVGEILCKHRSGDDSIYRAYQVVKVTETGVKIQQIAVENGIPIIDKFTGEAAKQKKVVKSKFSDFVGVYDDDWQLHKYSRQGKAV
jgi:hypothetical protein